MNIPSLPNDIKWKKIKYQAGCVPIRIINLGIFPANATLLSRVVIQFSLDPENSDNFFVFPENEVPDSRNSSHIIGELRFLVCCYMISARNRCDFILPKGSIEKSETLSVCAKRESMEEAGITCVLSSVSGIPGYHKVLSISKLIQKTFLASKSHQPCSIGEFHSIRKDLVKSRVLYLLGFVGSALPTWEEAKDRTRLLLSMDDSLRSCTRLGTYSAITGAKQSLKQLFDLLSIVSTLPPPIAANWKTHLDLTDITKTIIGEGELYSSSIKMETHDLSWLKTRLSGSGDGQIEMGSSSNAIQSGASSLTFAQFENDDHSTTFHTFPEVSTGYYDGISISTQGLATKSVEFSISSIETRHYSIRNFILALNTLAIFIG